MIRIKSDKLRYNGVCICNTAGIEINRGVTAVVGANGAGKSTFARILEFGWNYMTNEIVSTTDVKPAIRTLAFSDIHSLSGFKTEYYQQRYESTMNDDTPTVADLFGERLESNLWREISKKLGLSGVEGKRLNFLSSGELRKLLIINMLFDLPDLLILDNPYIGLDAGSRAAVDRAISDIVASGTSVMVLVSDPEDIPSSASDILCMEDMAFLHVESPRCLFHDRIDVGRVDGLLQNTAFPVGMPVVDMHACRVSYGSHVLIDSVDWLVRSGECWALTGRNGSGKSTLLSLVNADNPQAYSNDISLFGRRRGTGESIWDIKDRIGYLSSELHLYFNGRSDTLRRVVGGGFSSFTGYASDAAETDIDRWLAAFGMDGKSACRFNTLSFGEQRLALFIRAIVKCPELLILDEPMHGLDASVKDAVRRIVELVSAKGTTIIYVTHNPAEMPMCVTHKKVLP